MLKSKWTDNVKGQVTTGGGFGDEAIAVWGQTRTAFSQILPYKIIINGQEQENVVTDEIKAYFEKIREQASLEYYKDSKKSPTNNQESKAARAAPTEVDFYDNW